MVGLKELNLGGVGLGESGMRIVWEGLGSNRMIGLEKVDLSGNQNINGKGKGGF